MGPCRCRHLRTGPTIQLGKLVDILIRSRLSIGINRSVKNLIRVAVQK